MDMAATLRALPRAVELASPGVRNTRWQPGRAAPLHSEIFAPAAEASGAGGALALALDGLRARAAANDAGDASAIEEKAILWVQEARAIKLGGRPYRAGLPEDWRHRLIHVAAKTPEDALFALEEGVRCRDFACVIGEVAGNPKALDFTASRRLSLAAEKHGVPLFLVRLDAAPDLSSARMRWRLRAAPSAPPLWNASAPGKAAWQAELFRARKHPPGEWVLREQDGRLVQLALSGQAEAEGRVPPASVTPTAPASAILSPAGERAHG
ncbi:recA-like protein [Erythrobacter sp. EC-HK427]|uniref:recA-like protein n=1 Tax=Erythrobacter sp. EC-HK427 TaxID=2038396 RepID=UPI00125A3A58|nr:recA-like protein [Erythrobacter sp. EC-HK427]VVT14734.1 conserved hypothetical protein [Erythrobacter sp. EC-HK427]